MSPAPSVYHQRIIGRLFSALDAFAREHKRGEVLLSPVDVYLSEEDTLQPDLVFVAKDRRAIIGEQKIEGAPDLVVEVLSPSTAYALNDSEEVPLGCLDLTKKKRLYETHGVKEYWTVDPEQQAVEVFENTDGGFVQHARVVESGTAASALLDSFSTDLAHIF